MRAAGRLTATPAGTIELVEPRSGYEGSCRAHGNDGRAIGGILARIGDKWSLLVIATLHEGRLRFGELQVHIPGISQRVLTLTVRQLERDGIVTRTVFPEVPRANTHLPTVLVAERLAERLTAAGPDRRPSLANCSSH